MKTAIGGNYSCLVNHSTGSAVRRGIRLASMSAASHPSHPSHPSPSAAGLCDSCRHQRVVRNTRGSSFSLCRRSREDERYPRYPRLPVLRCPGHEERVAVVRCWPTTDALYIAYHDEEWGRPVRDEQRLLERLCLEAFQSGLAWITILRKRENFRAAFARFDPAT